MDVWFAYLLTYFAYLLGWMYCLLWKLKMCSVDTVPPGSDARCPCPPPADPATLGLHTVKREVGAMPHADWHPTNKPPNNHAKPDTDATGNGCPAKRAWGRKRMDSITSTKRLQIWKGKTSTLPLKRREWNLRDCTIPSCLPGSSWDISLLGFKRVPISSSSLNAKKGRVCLEDRLFNPNLAMWYLSWGRRSISRRLSWKTTGGGGLFCSNLQKKKTKLNIASYDPSPPPPSLKLLPTFC